eukprot:jgi/Orpsp1_1/1183862/evm.model.c7180000086981.1
MNTNVIVMMLNLQHFGVTQAISQALEYPIVIIQAESAPIEIGTDFPKEKLYIS